MFPGVRDPNFETEEATCSLEMCEDDSLMWILQFNNPSRIRKI